MHLFIKAQQDQCIFMFFCFFVFHPHICGLVRNIHGIPSLQKWGTLDAAEANKLRPARTNIPQNVQGTTAEGIYRTRASRPPTCSDLLSNHNTERSGDAGEIPSGMPPRLRASRQEFLPASTVCCTSGSTQPVKKKKVLPGDWRKWAHFSSQTAPDLWLS